MSQRAQTGWTLTRTFKQLFNVNTDHLVICKKVVSVKKKKSYTKANGIEKF